MAKKKTNKNKKKYNNQNYPTKEDWAKLLHKHPSYIKNMPKEFLTKNLCLYAANRDFNLIQYMK